MTIPTVKHAVLLTGNGSFRRILAMPTQGSIIPKLPFVD